MNPTATPTITAIVPARNEERTIETCVRSLAAQPEIAEIRAVNDGSTDGTAEILTRLAADIPRLRVIEAGPLTSGWVGKNHAAWIGAQDAWTEWLLFTDSDVRHLPGSAAHALANGELRGAALVSYSPAQRMDTWWERAMIPFVFARLAHRYPYNKVNDPSSRVAAANGQYLLIRRDAYTHIGGHRAIAGDILEDVALARNAKTAGLLLHFAPGEQIARTHMYTTFRDMWEGWAKNLYPLFGGTPASAVLELVKVLPIPEIMLIATALVCWQKGVPEAGIGSLIALAAGAGYTFRERLAHPIVDANIKYWSFGRILFCAALVASAWRHAQGVVPWKGRTYPARP